jgi:hypothetical protein
VRLPAVGAETILPCSGAATTIRLCVHARPLTARDDCSEHEGEEVRGPPGKTNTYLEIAWPIGSI